MKVNKKEVRKKPQIIKYSFLKILTGSDLSQRRLPLMSAQSINPGPVVWLTACVHGDEVGGSVIIHDIFKKITKNPLLKGSLFAFPLMNPIGFEAASRNIIFSEEDLNRFFPGSKDGSLAERIADQTFSTIKATNPTLVLDLHNDWRKSIPYTLLDPDPGPDHRDAYEKTKIFCKKTGFLAIYDSDGFKKTLSYSLLLHDVPALSLELGESHIISEKNIEYGIKSVCNILAHLGMIEPDADPFSYPVPEEFRSHILAYSQKPLCSTSGIIRFLVKPGEIVKKGQLLGKIYNTFGKLMENIISLHDGIILGNTDSSVAFPGASAFAFGVTAKNTPADKPK